jgi:hypothetical protein
MTSLHRRILSIDHTFLCAASIRVLHYLPSIELSRYKGSEGPQDGRHVVAQDYGANPGEARQVTLFISYSRSDMGVADQLVEDLDQHGFDIRIDRRNLPFGEQWQKVLAQFIVEADAVVWLI